ncbi:MAG: bifunctional 4-hydroxy-3-methylbut-2-enyl diphosphate reductase/30S ribosomal protein S1 [Oscillospiraceae bacterium]|nr:bifunctional 4-hydroxy-3-methylbut-2-enyl diphosphate reductase/30S ribosomal protein S1 [Oscillospiraceae bacterium]
MIIEIAENAGFCFGVNRAIAIAESAAAKYGEVWTLGELIHNEVAVREFNSRGIHCAQSLSEVENKPLVIRSHGVSEETESQACKICAEVIDATCPFVKKIHKIVSSLPENSKLLVLGAENHPEIVGIIGRTQCETFPVKNFGEIDELFKSGALSESDRIVLVTQTTFDRNGFLECVDKIREKYRSVEINDTICEATVKHQKSTRELAKRAALMVVVGGRGSSNTRKLAEICEKYCPTVFVTTADEIPLQTLRSLRSDSIIGITAGASTPAHTIKEVHEKMNKEITTNIENEEDFASLLEQDQSFNKLYTGKRVKATVVSVSKKEAVVEVGAKQTGYILREEITSDPNADIEELLKVGDVIDAIVTKVDDSVGTAYLSKKRVDAALGLEKLQKAMEANETIEGNVSQVVKGGVIVIYENTRVFIPASLTGVPRNGKLDELLKKPVKFKIIEVSNERGGRVVGSIRQARRETRDAERAKFWENIEVGQKFEGIVRSIESYGVFVDIGPIDGLVHTADLTWNRVGHPKDIVSIGDKMNVIVKSYDPEKKRVSLSAKDPDENPWNKFTEQFAIDDVIKATIVSITEFGAFAQIIPGVDGLIHISQISLERVTNIGSVLKVGDEVEAKIIDIDDEKNRVSLSIKATLQDTED